MRNVSCITLTENTSYRVFMIFTILDSIPQCLSSCHIPSLLTLSNAFSKSIKFMYNDDCHSTDCSAIILRVAIWSVEFLLDLPACSFRKTLSTASFIMFNMTLQKILLAIGSKDMPLQFSQQLKSPLLGSFTSSPLILFHSIGILSASQILFYSLHKYARISSPPYISMFQRLRWYTIKFPPLYHSFDFKAFLISCFFILSTFMQRSSSGVRLPVDLVLAYSEHMKCSFHLSICSFSLVRTLPSLSLTDLAVHDLRLQKVMLLIEF